jgi:RNA polymerase sigma-70 factor (ECF subfamily)
VVTARRLLADQGAPADPCTGPGVEAEPSTARTGPREARAELSDEALVLAARDGQLWAEQALFQRHARMALGLAHRLLAERADRDDLVQDGFVQALEHLPALKDPSRFAAWLRAIIVRGASRRMRRHRLLVRLGFRHAVPYDLEALAGPSVPIEVQHEVRRVYSWLHALPAEERVALVLRRIDELEIEQIAREMNVSPMTVKRRLKSAEQRLERLRGRPLKR